MRAAQRIMANLSGQANYMRAVHSRPCSCMLMDIPRDASIYYSVFGGIRTTLREIRTTLLDSCQDCYYSAGYRDLCLVHCIPRRVSTSLLCIWSCSVILGSSGLPPSRPIRSISRVFLIVLCFAQNHFSCSAVVFAHYSNASRPRFIRPWFSALCCHRLYTSCHVLSLASRPVLLKGSEDSYKVADTYKGFHTAV